jgi:hypothetical protein
MVADDSSPFFILLVTLKARVKGSHKERILGDHTLYTHWKSTEDHSLWQPAIIIVGLFMTSLITQYYQILLAQGVCTGFGIDIFSMPGLSVPASYFKANKSLAVSIIASGAGTGGLVYSTMAQQLVPRVGFSWTIRSMAFVTIFMSILVNLLVRVCIPARRSGPLFDFHALKEPAYAFFCIGSFFVYWAVYCALYYVRLVHLYIFAPSFSTLCLTFITARSISMFSPTPPSPL